MREDVSGHDFTRAAKRLIESGFSPCVVGHYPWAPFLSNEVTEVKQYLVVKVAESLSQVMNLIALPGLYTLESAQQFIQQATAADPNLKLLIQEVGAA